MWPWIQAEAEGKEKLALWEDWWVSPYIRWPIYPQADANYTELLVASNKNQTELLKTDKGWRAGLRACAKRTHTLNHAVLRIRGDTTTVPAQENHNCLWTNRL